MFLNDILLIMYRTLSILLAAVLCAPLAWAQGDTPATAGTVATPFYTLGSPNAGTLVGATASGVVADGNLDRFYHFVAETQGLKIEVVPTGFDARVEVLDLAETVLGTEDVTGAGGTETMFANFLVPGNEYYIRVSASSDGAYTLLTEVLPEAELRANYSPDPPVDAGLVGYKMGDQAKRNNINTTVYPVNLTGFVQATMWEFVDQLDGSIYTHTVTGSNGTLVLDDVAIPALLCFGRTYDVRVQLRMEAKWCGWGPARELITEAVPDVYVLPQYLNTSQLLQPGFLRTNYLGDGQAIEWHLETNQGSPDGPTVIDYSGIGNSTYIYFQNVECMRYNKIYSVEVRAQYCGVWGPWSAPEAFYTSPLPYTNVRPEFCDLEMYVGDGLFSEFIEGADQYAWQAAPIDPDDETMTPIGPALVTTTPTTTLTLSALGLEWGQSYRLGCKAILGTADECDDYQEGDYGYFCPIHIIDPSAFVTPGEGMAAEGPETEQIYADDRLEVVSTSSDNILTLDVASADFDGYTDFMVLDMQGRLVATQQLVVTPEMNRVQFAMNKDLPMGVYLVKATQGDQQLDAKFIIH